jgi:molybdate transport system ATP-binding protein
VAGGGIVADTLEVSLRQTGPIPLAIDFTVAPGEALALVGPSGAGKSTVLRAIAGLYRPAEGRIACGSRVWFDSTAGIDLAPRARQAGLVFQSYALFPHMTALGNVAEAMLDQPRKLREDRAAALLARVHLDGLEMRLPRALSGGQQQRVALARALARDPAILLLDEPFSAVDQPTRRALHRLLARIRATTPAPMVFVSHDVEDAASSANRICFVEGGTTIEQGPTNEMLKAGSALTRWLDNERDDSWRSG